MNDPLYYGEIGQNEYARKFTGVLRFKNVDSARKSIERIDALFHEFARANDRRGQHQAQLMALIGKNRAEGIGKLAEARLFWEWLIKHSEPVIEPENYEPFFPEEWTVFAEAQADAL